jgi:hypothetical protein
MATAGAAGSRMHVLMRGGTGLLRRFTLAGMVRRGQRPVAVGLTAPAPRPGPEAPFPAPHPHRA